MAKKADNRRDIFGELTEGFEALQDAREGKQTLQTTEMELKDPLEITAAEIRSPQPRPVGRVRRRVRRDLRDAGVPRAGAAARQP